MYFDAQYLPPAQSEYVVWLDVMGIGPVMGRSLSGAANFVFKLHAAALRAPATSLKLYPVMDGLYAATSNQADMLAFLRSVFAECAQEFAAKSKDDSLKRFIIRGAIAFGPVVHGSSVPDAAFQPPGNAPNPVVGKAAYKDSLLLGLPMVQAHDGERLAPPFGLYVHESARAFAPAGVAPLGQVWWRWCALGNPLWTSLWTALDGHYDWYKARSRSLEYALDRLEIHRAMAEEYFLQPG